MGSGHESISCTAFVGERMISSGDLEQVVATAKDVLKEDELAQVLIFDDATSKLVEVDFRGTKDSVLARLALEPSVHKSGVDDSGVDATIATATPTANSAPNSPRPVGRPRLGVVPGEVTLLPRHWQWLKSQPGGASVTLRKLIDEARRAREQQDKVRQAQEATYRFMTVMAGNYPHYEEALRALYAGDSPRFYEFIAHWPTDIHEHIKYLAKKAFPENEAGD